MIGGDAGSHARAEREAQLTSRPKRLCLIHLPPPVHGVTVVNQRVAASAAIAERTPSTPAATLVEGNT